MCIDELSFDGEKEKKRELISNIDWELQKMNVQELKEILSKCDDIGRRNHLSFENFIVDTF